MPSNLALSVFGLFINFKASCDSRSLVCVTTSFRTVISKIHCISHFHTHEGDDICIFATKCPTSDESGWFVIVDFASNEHALQETNNIVWCLVSSVCYVWSIFYSSSVWQINITFHKEMLYSLAQLSNRVIEENLNSPTSPTKISRRSLNARTRCSTRPFA